MIKWITWKKLSDKQPRATDRVNQVTQEIRKFYVNDSVVEIQKGYPSFNEKYTNLVGHAVFIKRNEKKWKRIKLAPPLNTL